MVAELIHSLHPIENTSDLLNDTKNVTSENREEKCRGLPGWKWL